MFSMTPVTSDLGSEENFEIFYFRSYRRHILSLILQSVIIFLSTAESLFLFQKSKLNEYLSMIVSSYTATYKKGFFPLFQ